MAEARYFLEIHIPGNKFPNLRKIISDNHQVEKHLHITLVRPFSLKSNEKEVKNTIIQYCRKVKPIPYILHGLDSFSKDIVYIPVVSKKLHKFDADLEKTLENFVSFDTKLSKEKILHLTIDPPIKPFAKTKLTMSRLTCIRDRKDGKGKRIWFSYNFVTQTTLNRKETLKEIKQESRR